MRVPTGVIPLSSAPSSVICFANATFPPAGEGRGSATERPLSHGLRRDSSPKGGAKGRAATWGRPYDVSGPSTLVGADLCVRPGPLVKGGCHRREAVTGGFRRPEMGQVAPSSVTAFGGPYR